MRTVRSAAWSRNRPRRRVAWLLLVILLVLIALVARVDAAPGGDPIDLAIRYADALSGAAHAPATDDGEDEDSEDEDAERAALDGDREDEDEEIVDRSEPADRELAALTGGIAWAVGSPLGDRDDAGGPAGLTLDDDAAGESANLTLGDDDAADAGLAGPGALAMLDAELAPGDATTGLDAADAAATAGAEEVYEQWMRHRRPSPWGRLDVGVSWRRRWSKPIHTPANRYDEVWLVATWRR